MEFQDLQPDDPFLLSTVGLGVHHTYGGSSHAQRHTPALIDCCDLADVFENDMILGRKLDEIVQNTLLS